MKILVAVDGSKPSLNAVKYAAKLEKALRGKNKITLVNAQDDEPFRHKSDYVSEEQIEDIVRDRSERELKAARGVLDKLDIPHDIAILTGRVSKEILSLANREKFDLIVLGSKGRGSIKDLLLGSVAQRISAAAKQPVFLVK